MWNLRIMTGDWICTGGCGCDTHRNTLTRNLLAAGRCFLEVTEFMKMAFVARNFHCAQERVTDNAIVKQYVQRRDMQSQPDTTIQCLLLAINYGTIKSMTPTALQRVQSHQRAICSNSTLQSRSSRQTHRYLYRLRYIKPQLITKCWSERNGLSS